MSLNTATNHLPDVTTRPALLKHPYGPCPDWCTRHEVDDAAQRWHVSAPRVWGRPESPTFEFELVRHDGPDSSEISSVGAIDFNFRVFFSDDEPDDAFNGYMEVSWVRDLTTFLGALLMTADPHNTNGEHDGDKK